MGGNPTLRFEGDPEKYAPPLRRVTVTIRPMIEGKADESVVYRPTQHLVGPDDELHMNAFEYVGPDGYRRVSRLPTGPYQLTLRVIARKHRDRQVILMSVR